MSSAEQIPSPVRVFWGEIAPADHIAHFYNDEKSFLVTLAGFIAEGLANGESAIIIATPQHLARLEERLEKSGLDLPAALLEERYIALDAEAALASFMRKNWPDDRLFAEMVGNLIRRASRKGRRVRAFGEMVALLWAQGQQEATIRLEYLWNVFCRDYGFCLLCSYPKAGFTKDPQQSIAEICGHHSRYLGNDWGTPAPAGEAA
ncbi:MAG TPA: MEDS domain-containing protein [Terracidiphilus sp.]|nr:MEDS domain-containing protein [Terracidiphilus sp.]